LTGTNCETETNLCKSDPCKNGGSCKSDNNSHVFCQCVGGYSGAHCEDIDACSSRPCQRGQCHSNGSLYDCKCPIGYTGNTCSKVVDLIYCEEGF
ncbi:hypothetical protein CHS0354_006668, partial [Potamilus streckersoni]